MDDERTPEPIGWNAINDALREVYGEVEPKHWGTVISNALGGPDPLTGISAYSDPTEDRYWHFVTYGLSELYEKESDDPDVSGYGFELTFRLAKKSPADELTWVLNFLQNLARYVFDTGNRFRAGHTMELNGPIRSVSETAIWAIALADDPDVKAVDSRNGRVEFLQIVGITMDDLDAIQSWNCEAFLDLIADKNPKLVTDIDRVSYMEEAAFAAEVRRRSTAEGSSSGSLLANDFSFSRSVFARRCKVRLGAYLVDGLTQRIASRIPFGQDFVLSGKETVIAFAPGPSNHWSVKDGVLEITLTATAAVSLRDVVVPRAGTYSVPGLARLTFAVRRTEIKDNDGNVTEIVG